MTVFGPPLPAAVATAVVKMVNCMLVVLPFFLAVRPLDAFQQPVQQQSPFTMYTNFQERRWQTSDITTARIRRSTLPFGVLFSHSSSSPNESSKDHTDLSHNSSSKTSSSRSSSSIGSSSDKDMMRQEQHGVVLEEEQDKALNDDDERYEVQQRKNLTAIVEKKMRVAKAKAEIDRILQSPDAPFDVEMEMQRVIQVFPRNNNNIDVSSAINRGSSDGSSISSSSNSSPDISATTDSSAMTDITASVAQQLQQQQKQEDEQIGPSSNHQDEIISFQNDQEEQQREEQIMQLEQDLYKAVKEQDYTRAAMAEQQVDQMHLDDCGAVLQVNAAFYRAFSQKDYEKMSQLWLHDAASTCIHPSHKALVGSKAVLASWRKMFASPNVSFQRNWMEPHQIRITVKGASVAIVTCEEHVYSRRFVRGQKRTSELVNKLQATNIFRKVAGQKWYLIHHHASWHADSEPAKRALMYSGGAATANLMSSSSRSTSSGNSGSIRFGRLATLGGNSNTGFTSLNRIALRRRNVFNSDIDDDDDDDDYDDDDDDEANGSNSALNGIMGCNNYGPLLGDGSSSPSTNDGILDPTGQKPTKHIVMGSLSDILNGKLGDILSNDNIMKNTKSNNINGQSSSSSANNGGTGSAFIRFERLQQAHEDEDLAINEKDEDDIDSDDEEDDVEDDEDDDDDEEEDDDEAVLMMKKWAETRSTLDDDDIDASAPQKASEKKSSSSSSSIVDSPAKTDASFRQGCILALRKLCDRGSISPKQKRVLLTDIITSSAKGEFSMVEVAYELLLCTDEEVDTPSDSSSRSNRAIAEEEFADQCRVFAMALPESMKL